MPLPNPKISVIVPVYNTEKYLRRCVDSILAQTFTNYELLLIDDGSKDSSGDICDEYAANDIRLLVFHKENGGVSSARNVGIDNMRGEWVTFVDSDDWIDSCFLEVLLQKAHNANAEVAFCDSVFEYTNKRHIYEHYDWKKQGNAGLMDFMCSTWTCLWGCLVNSSLISKNRLYCPIGVGYCEDFHLIVRICFYANIITKVNTALYHYFQRENSAVHNISSFSDEEMWVYLDIAKFFSFHCVEADFRRTMAWRMLKCSRPLALDVRLFESFIRINQGNKAFILGCPFVTRVGQLNMWFLTHGFTFLSFLYCFLRKWLNRIRFFRK